MSQNNIIERTLELPTEGPITKSEEFGLDGVQYKFSYTIERLGEEAVTMPTEEPSQSSEESSEETSSQSSQSPKELLETTYNNLLWQRKEPVYTYSDVVTVA